MDLSALIEQQFVPLKILVVEDDLVFNVFYENFLSHKGATVTSCFSLQSALSALKEPNNSFDAIILDNQLSDGDGISLLPFLLENRSQPAVIMVSGNDDNEFFLTAFKAGIHDYMVKPVNLDLLWLKINNAVNQLRLKELSGRQRLELESWVEQEQHQQTLAKHLFDTLYADIHQHHPAIHIWMQPCGVFSGDAILSFKAKDGCWYFILADAMGHGLAPAVSLMPLMQSFQMMVAKALPLSNIVFELNGLLNRLLPPDRFVAAILIRLDPWRQQIEIWNGGMPSVQCLSNDGRLVSKASSSNMALGVLANSQISVLPQVIPLKNVAYLVLYSDGLTETPLASGHFLNSELLSTTLLLGKQNPLAPLQNLFEQVRADDDVSICAIDCSRLLSHEQSEVNQLSLSPALFSAEFQLQGVAVVQVDLAAKVIELLREQNLPQIFLQRVFTVVTELFANALEHGLLGLDSKIKDSENGFIVFYEEKERRLLAINELDFIEFKMQWSNSLQKLSLYLKDSGQGFLPYSGNSNADSTLHGRGLSLIEKLTSSFKINPPGNCFEIEMINIDSK